jgi:hypothetical protein
MGLPIDREPLLSLQVLGYDFSCLMFTVYWFRDYPWKLASDIPTWRWIGSKRASLMFLLFGFDGRYTSCCFGLPGDKFQPCLRRILWKRACVPVGFVHDERLEGGACTVSTRMDSRITRRKEGSRVMASDEHPLGANLHSISSNGTKEPETQKVLLEAQIPNHE